MKYIYLLGLLIVLFGCSVFNKTDENKIECPEYEIINEDFKSILKTYIDENYLGEYNVFTINCSSFNDTMFYEIYCVCNQSDLEETTPIISKIDGIYVLFYFGINKIVDNQNTNYLFEKAKSTLYEDGYTGEYKIVDNDTFFYFIPGITYDHQNWLIKEFNNEFEIVSKKNVCNTNGLFHD